MGNRSLEWLRRYSIPEFLGILGAYCGVYGYQYIAREPSDLTASIVGTWGENFGYYLLLVISDHKRTISQNKKLSRINRYYKTARGLVIEFGLAEILDSFLIRPAALFYCMNYFGTGLGLLIGKVVADIAFYFPTILFYELRKKYDY